MTPSILGVIITTTGSYMIDNRSWREGKVMIILGMIFTFLMMSVNMAVTVSAILVAAAGTTAAVPP